MVKKHNFKTNLKKVQGNHNIQQSILPDKQPKQQLTVTERLQQLRLESNKKEKLTWDQVIFDNDRHYLFRNRTNKFTRDSIQTIAGPSAPASWLSTSFYKPNEKQQPFRKDSLFHIILDLIYRDFKYTLIILNNLENIPVRIKHQLIKAIIPRLKEPDELLLKFKSVFYTQLDVSKSNVTSLGLTRFLGKVEIQELEVVDNWEDIHFMKKKDNQSHMQYLNYLNVNNCTRLDISFFKHLSLHFTHLHYLEIQNTLNNAHLDLIIYTLNLISKNLVHLVHLNAYHISWKYPNLIIEKLDFSSLNFPSLKMLILYGEPEDKLETQLVNDIKVYRNNLKLVFKKEA